MILCCLLVYDLSNMLELWFGSGLVVFTFGWDLASDPKPYLAGERDHKLVEAALWLQIVIQFSRIQCNKSPHQLMHRLID